MGTILPPTTHTCTFGNSEDISDCHKQNCYKHLQVEVGMLLNSLQCTGQDPTEKNNPAQNVNSVAVEKFFLGIWH